MKKWIYRNALLLLISWAVLIFILCATPGQYIPTASWLELLSFDKFVHAALFFFLTSLCFLVAIKHQQSKTIQVIYFLTAVSYGALLELMQATCFSNRSADWKDIAANSFGCLVAVLFYKKARIFFLKTQIN